ncbi:MAG: ABC-type transport auxiliary lipoprotein family protein [Planctomycetota bacterium]
MTRFVVCAGLMALASCGVSVGPQERPELTYYHLSIPAPEPSSRPMDVDVVVMPFSQSSALDRDGVRYRKSDVEGGFWENHLWVEPVESMLRCQAQQYFVRSGRFRRVVLLEDAGYAGVLIMGEVVRFDEEDRDGGWIAVAEIDFDVVRRCVTADERDCVVLSRTYRCEEPVAEKSVPEIVRALSRATESILAELGEDIGEVLK